MQEIRVWSLGWEEPLEKGMATHSSILAWRIPCTEEPGNHCSDFFHYWLVMPFLDFHINEIGWFVLWVGPLSLRRFCYALGCINSSFCSWLVFHSLNILQPVYPIHLLMDIWFIHRFGLLGIIRLLWTVLYKSSCRHMVSFLAQFFF